METKCFYTIYGDVYQGADYDGECENGALSNCRIIIPYYNIKTYNELPNSEKTIETIEKYGWIVHENAIRGHILYNPSQSCNLPPSINGVKTMFIFGAGASVHCIFGDNKGEFENDILRPPLGKDLFDSCFKGYYEKYEGVKLLRSNLLGDDFNIENLFENEWKDIAKNCNIDVMKKHINIQYYLQELLKTISNNVITKYDQNLYSTLISELQKIHQAKINNGNINKFAFVSFNYDTILDYFLSKHFNQPLNSLDDYANEKATPFCLFKPHGSWNWGWKFLNPYRFDCNNTAKWLYENNKNFYNIYFEELGNHIDMVDWSYYEKWNDKNNRVKYTIDKSKIKLIDSNANLNFYFPALLLPYRDKDEFVMPKKHFYFMENCFKSVETLIIIGWKGNEELFNRQLLKHANNLKKVIIADPEHEKVEENLKDLLSKPNIEKVRYKEGFKDFVKKGIEEHIK